MVVDLVSAVVVTAVIAVDVDCDDGCCRSLFPDLGLGFGLLSTSLYIRPEELNICIACFLASL